MDIHIDPLGGWSGDMFVAAMLDAFPEHWPAVRDAIRSVDLGPHSDCDLVTHRDTALTGQRFLVAAEEQFEPGPAHRRYDHEHGHEHHHHPVGDHAHGPHRAWAEIRALIATSPLHAKTKDHALGIFGLLAEAEAEVHGVAVDAVMFHEVGAVDSIVDIVAAAEIARLIDCKAWTSAPLPIGSGRVMTQHGILPIPAPATALLLRGLATIDDGIPGERVTPTGAAVARYLTLGAKPGTAQPRRLLRSGTGFGQRQMPGMSNCLRVLAFEPIAATPVVPNGGRYGHRDLAVITFEVDDQSSEDLTAGLDHLRAMAGVHDVVQSTVFGKKGRLATHVQVLAAPDDLGSVIDVCFEETTTIGLRYHRVEGAALVRSFEDVPTSEGSLRVKAVRRPGGVSSAKTEAADVAAVRGHEARMRLRREAEAAVLSRQAKDDDHAG